MLFHLFLHPRLNLDLCLMIFNNVISNRLREDACSSYSLVRCVQVVQCSEHIHGHPFAWVHLGQPDEHVVGCQPGN